MGQRNPGHGACRQRRGGLRGGSDGTVYGVSARAGTLVWSGTAGSTTLGLDEQNADVLIGISVSDGLLVVLAGNALTAFGD